MRATRARAGEQVGSSRLGTRGRRQAVVWLGVAALVLAGATNGEAQGLQLTPIGGWGVGGSVSEPASGPSRSLRGAFLFGGALDVRLSQSHGASIDQWNLELFHSRQASELSLGESGAVEVTVERYLLGLQEEKGDERFRWFGTFFLGATRFVPELPGYDAELRVTGGLGLGSKSFFGEHLGLRLEARGLYTSVPAEAGFLCSGPGDCLFAYGGGIWQGELAAGLILAF